MFCAYCGTDHDKVVVFSNEDVVPYAIGGTRKFTIRVCEKSNNDLGGLADKPFIESFFVGWKRFSLGLCGTDGTQPTFDLSGNSTISGEDVQLKYIIGPGDKKLLTVLPRVTEIVTDDGLRRRLSGDPATVRRILIEMLSGAHAKGKRVRTPDGVILNESNLDAFLASGDLETTNPGIVKIIAFDKLEYVRFFAKLALATGHYIFGENFSRSARAEILRRVMFAKNPSEAVLGGARIRPDIGEAEGKAAFGPFRKRDTHVLGILCRRPTVVIVSLFGDIEGVIALGEVNDPSLSNGGRILQIDLPSREFHDFKLDDYLMMQMANRVPETRSKG